MFNFSYVTLNVNLGNKFWQHAALTTGGILCCYGLYRIITKKRKVGDVTNKCVFVTGCDSGFGRAIALKLDSLNVPVFAGCLTTNGAKSLQDEASELLKIVQVDVCSSKSIKDAYNFVCDNIPLGAELWAIVNNAGIAGPGGPTEFLKRTEFDQVMQVNFLGQVDVVNTFLPLLKRSRGRIINFASIAARIPIATNPAYCASKFAVLGYTQSLRLEKKPWGIGVSAILPGLFATGMTNFANEGAAKKKQWDNLPEDIKAEYGQEYFDAKMKLAKNFVEGNSLKTDLSPVTNAIEHALFSTKPKAVYLVGADAMVLSFIEKLPFGMSQFISDKINGIPSAIIPHILKGMS